MQELWKIAKVACVYFWNVAKYSDDNDVNNIVFVLARNRLMRGYIIYSYVIGPDIGLPELLSRLVEQSGAHSAAA